LPVSKPPFEISSTVGAVVLLTDTISSAKQPVSSRKENVILV
jgi:hypothetical protein